MALRDMIGNLSGRIPKLSSQLARTFINDALSKIGDENTWSFNLFESGWLTQNLVQAGTITATIGSASVTGNAAAAAAWAALGLNLTKMQIRLPAYNLYSVIAFASPVITLDRPWMEPAGAGLSYLMYQAYYPSPVASLKRWLTIRDFTNAANLDFWSKKQSDLAANDPPRTIFQNPSCVVPFKSDTRGQGTATPSPTLGYMLYELYPHPLAQLPYALYGEQNLPALTNPGDTIPYPLTEECVLHRARELAYEWKESQKGDDTHRGSGADWKFLRGAAKAEYDDRIKDIRKSDRDLVDSFVTKIRRRNATLGAPFYSAVTNTASVGGF